MAQEQKSRDDVVNADILHLLKAAETHQERAMLSVMLQMTRALDSNTTATKAIAEGFHAHVAEFKLHREEFDKHIRDEIALFAQGRGMQKMLTYTVSGLGVVMTVIMGMGLYILNGHVEGIVHERDMNNQQERRITILEQTPHVNTKEFEALRNRIFILENQK